MRIRKGPRCVPLMTGAMDRSFLLLKGFAADIGRRGDDENQCSAGVHQVVGGGAAISGCQDLDHAGTECREVDRVQRKRLSADGYSRKRGGSGGPIAETAGVISISSIIQAGVKMEPVSANSVVAMDCSLAAMNKSSIDQPNTLLLQSLKRVCSAAEGTGLTAKEAVTKIQEQGLPGLIIEGGERLIVQVAKSFRSSSAFVEREERGRYFITQESTNLDDWDNFQATDSTTEREEASAAELSSGDADFETVIEAAKQLQKLQEPITVELADKSGTNRWVLALRGNSMTGHRRRVEAPSTPQKASSDQSAPRCNRDDGKGWRCVRVAESGFSLCKYHRDQIRRAEIRRRKARNKSKKQQSRVQPAVKPSNPTVSKDVVTVSASEAEETVDDGKAAIDSDNELPDHMRRRFVKAKSLKSLL